MKNYFKYDFIKKAIVGSESAIKRANSGKGNEYLELCKMLTEHPDFKVISKPIKKNENKRYYSNLTFEKMKKYILATPNGEMGVKELEAVMKVAEAKGAKYPLTKKWFLKTYHEYKDSEIELPEEMSA